MSYICSRPLPKINNSISPEVLPVIHIYRPFKHYYSCSKRLAHFISRNLIFIFAISKSGERLSGEVDKHQNELIELPDFYLVNILLKFTRAWFIVSQHFFHVNE